MYDDTLVLVVLERLRGVLQDLVDHPVKGLLALAGIVLIAVWLTRK